MGKISLLMFLSLFIISCTSMSEITQIGKNSYMMSNSTNAPKSGGELKAQLVKEASLYCSKMEMVFLLDGFSTVDQGFGRMGSSEISFSCLNENDPNYTKGNAKYENSPGANTSTGIGVIIPIR